MPRLFEKQASAGKGQGLFAITAIPKGTRIISDVPLVVVESESPLAIYLKLRDLGKSAPQQLKIFEALYDIGHLPASGQTTQGPNYGSGAVSSNKTWLDVYVKQLEDSNWELLGQQRTPTRRIPNLDLVEGAKALARFNLNSFVIRNTTNSGPAWAIFENVSLMNHSCVPNCNVSWNQNTRRLCVHAIRDIQEGEELYMTYLSQFLTFTGLETRTRELRSRYGFTCTCSACTTLVNDGNRGPSNREKIEELNRQRAILTSLKGKASPEGEKLLDDMLELMEDESLETWEKGVK